MKQAVVQKPKATLQGQCFIKLKTQDKEKLKNQQVVDDDLDDNVYAFIKHKTGVDIFNLDSTKDQGMAEAKDDYVPPKEANYGKKYQDMVLRVGEKARAQEKAKQQQPKAPVRESRKALLKQIIQS